MSCNRSSYIKKRSFKMETVKSVQQSILVKDWAVSIDLIDAYLHIPIHPQSRKYFCFVFENQVFLFTALPFGMFLSLWIFTKLMDVIAAHLHQRAISFFSLPRSLAYKRSNLQQTDISHNTILPSNSSKSRVHSKSKEVRFDTSSAIHLYRNGISETTQHSQGTSGSHRIPTSDYQIISTSDSSSGTKCPFSFEQTQCSSRLHSPRQTSFLQMCLLSVWRSHILFLDHRVPINSMIQFHLKWWMDTNRFPQGMSIHPPDPNAFLFMDASHYG